MRTKRRPASRIPEVNLVPMMDVLMTVLIFFVIISMSLTGVSINGVTLPKSVSGVDAKVTDKAEAVKPFTIGLDNQANLVLEGKKTDLPALSPAIEAYFRENPDGSLLLKADRDLPYDDIAALLSELRETGGRRVALAVE